MSFKHFMEYFPEVDLPISIGESTHYAFSQNNEPLPIAAIMQYLIPIEENEVDEFTEFIPCLRIPTATYDFQAIIYWRADLLNYQYTLATFNKKTGVLIDKKVIAGTRVENNVITQSVATIEDNWLINIATGRVNVAEELSYDANKSKIYEMELLTDGSIIKAL
ncbi:MAG: hypothetical protein HC912_01180 [Saprospiraceae bacterium]|nr:hypothetical protein [Saprospiraceae bacterium]